MGIIDTGDGPVAHCRRSRSCRATGRTGSRPLQRRETTFYTPARLSEAFASAAAERPSQPTVHSGCGTSLRVDLIIDAAGTPWFLEANVLPGLTETSLVPQALSASGFDLGWTYAELAEQAIRDHRA